MDEEALPTAMSLRASVKEQGAEFSAISENYCWVGGQLSCTRHFLRQLSCTRHFLDLCETQCQVLLKVHVTAQKGMRIHAWSM